MRVCIVEGRLKVACSLLYPILKIGILEDMDTH